MSLSAVITTRYGELRSRLDRHGELQFVGDGLQVAGIPAKPRVTVEIGSPLAMSSASAPAACIVRADSVKNRIRAARSAASFTPEG